MKAKKSSAPALLFCFCLHITLVLMHVALLVIWYKKLENQVLVPLSRGSLASTTRTVVSTIFITAYTAGMVVSIQQLALQRSLAMGQTLTAVNDEQQAWTGFGSALVSLYRQFSIAASVMGTILIAIYLACIAVLHITTPTLVRLQLFNHSGHALAPITLANPVFNESAYDSLIWPDLLTTLPYVSRVSESATLGLHDNIIYDILQNNNNGAFNVSVNATTFNIACGHLENVTATPAPGFTSYVHHTLVATAYNVEAVYEGYNFQLDVNLMVANALAASTGGSILDILGNNYVFVTTANIADSDGNSASTVRLHPPMYPLIFENSTRYPIRSLQVFGCTLSRFNGSALVDPLTRELVWAEEGAKKQVSKWRLWRPTPGSFSQDSTVLRHWAEALNFAPFTLSADPEACPANSSYGGCTVFVTDEFVMGDMGMAPTWNAKSAGLPNFTLDQLEFSLAKLSAAMYWSVGHISGSNGPDYAPVQDVSLTSFESGTAYISELMYCLELVIVPLLIGSITSIVLSVLAVVLIFRGSGGEPPVKNVGILQLLWFFSRRMDLKKWMSQIVAPSTSNLRAAGMFPVHSTGNGEENHALISNDGNANDNMELGSVG